ncbi:uncharacterized protein ARMOST_12966 [Armillaria ostoyae]|uniref:Transposase family Tnp2 protein n=1 Tax=Armillaria ostoyae TaxID=47428 RepID=A0A284RLE3_ARMOS|nr:uncharacterized protein ARMOST_12966 [Armillaria ostoyae]
MPRSPQPGASRRERRRYYDRDDSAALASLLSSRGREVPEILLTARRPGPLRRAATEPVPVPEHRERPRRVQERARRDDVEEYRAEQYDTPQTPPGSPVPPFPRLNTPSSPLENPDLHQPRREQPTGQRPHPARPHNPLFDAPTVGLESRIDEVKIAAQFIDALKRATLDDSNMDAEDIRRLREASPDLPFDKTDPDFLFALRTFFATTNSSEATYKAFLFAYKERHPEIQQLSFYQMKKHIERLSGVVPIAHDMCIDSCAGFTGPYKDLDACPYCSKPRYENGHPRRQFHTIPIGPIIQALYASPESAKKMRYRVQTTHEILEYANDNGGKLENYSDVYCGQEYLNAVRDGRIQDDDSFISISLDGAQLYRDKNSDCWMFIYLFYDLSPDYRYKKAYVIPGGVVGGPNKPKNTDSYLFPALYHLSALQQEGLRVWDSYQSVYFDDTPFLGYTLADGVAMANISGMVGCHGKCGCRLHCKCHGRRREGDGHYYPAMLKPNDYDIPGANHPDLTFADLHRFRQDIGPWYNDGIRQLASARNPAQYQHIRLETGLCRPTIFSGIHYSLGVPQMFLMDIMHLVCLNDPDLLLGLWRGVIQVYKPDSKDNWEWFVLKGKVWKSHGETIARATPFLPSSFDRAPRNPAEKINSGYKAWEYLLYLFALGPALLRSILPSHYWKNYCKLVRGIQLLQQHRKILPEQLVEGTRLLCEFVKEFEELYYMRREARLHFIRQSVHMLTHIGPETVRVGPLACYAQWVMETIIGNLGEEIRQDLDPYANISQRAILRAQMNCIRFQIPDIQLTPPTGKDSLPKHAKPVDGTGYLLLPRRQETLIDVSDLEADAIMDLWQQNQWPNAERWPRCVKRWGRLRLPNGQVARSFWMEKRAGIRRNLRNTRNVKININGRIDFAEVQYFFQLRFGEDIHTLALVSIYSPPNMSLLAESFQTVYTCDYQGDADLRAIFVTDIAAVVAMVPFFTVTNEGDIITPENKYFLVEKPGLEISELRGEEEDDTEGEEDADDV